MAGISFAVSTIFKSKDEQSKNFKRMGKNAKKFGKITEKSFKRASKSAKKFGTITKGILAAGAVQKVLSGIGTGVRSVVSDFIAFDDAIVGASARFKDIGPDSKNYEEQLKKIKKAAREAGATTEFTAAQSAEALNFMAKAGFTSADAIGSLNSMINLATATGEDFASVADMSSDLMGAFGLSVEDPAQKLKNLNRLNDVLVKTSNSANVTVEDMFETMKTIGPIATGVLGAGLEEVAALTAVMGDSGIKGTNAMTALKNAYLRLAAPVGKGAELMDELNLTLDDGQGGAKKMTTLMQEIGNKIGKFGKIKQARILDTIFGKRAIAGGKNLIDNIKKIKSFEKTLLSAGGTSQKTADLMRKSLGKRFKALGSAATDVGFQLLAAFKFKGSGAIETLTRLIRKIDLTPFINEIKTVVGIAGNIVTKFKEFGESSGLFDIVRESAAEMEEMFKKVFTAVVDVGKKFIEIGEKSGLFDKIKGAIKELSPVFKTLFEIASTVFDEIVEIVKVLDKVGAFDLMAKGAGLVVDAVVLLGEGIVKMWKIVKPILKAFTSAIKFLIEGVAKIIKIPSLFLGTEEAQAQQKRIREQTKSRQAEKLLREKAAREAKVFAALSPAQQAARLEQRRGSEKIKQQVAEQRAANQTQLESRAQQVNFSGRLDIAGDTEKATFTPTSPDAKQIDINELGFAGISP